MAATPDLKKNYVDELKRKLASIIQVIKTRNSPRSAYVRDFQLLSQPCTINVHCDIYKHLDLATAFKGLTIVTFTDEKSELQPGTSKQKDQRPFFYASLTPLPTTTEEEAEIPELVDIPLPEEVEQDKINWEDLQNLFAVLIKYGLKISPNKCQLFHNELIYMGLQFFVKDGVAHYTAMKEKCDAIRNMQTPKSIK